MVLNGPDVILQIWCFSNILPSQRNMSQMRSTEAHGSVREKAHMNHSVMYRMGSRLCFLRWRWAVGDTLCSRAYRISPSSWMASCGDGREQQSEQTPFTPFKPLRPSFKPSQQLEWLRHLHWPPVTCAGWQENVSQTWSFMGIPATFHLDIFNHNRVVESPAGTRVQLSNDWHSVFAEAAQILTSPVL